MLWGVWPSYYYRKMSSQGVGLLEFVCLTPIYLCIVFIPLLSTLFILSPSPAVGFELGPKVGLGWHCFSSGGTGGGGECVSMLGRHPGEKVALVASGGTPEPSVFTSFILYPREVK